MNVYIIAVLAAVLYLTKGDVFNEMKEPTCLSRFDFDYKLLTKLISLENELSALQNVLKLEVDKRSTIMRAHERHSMDLDELRRNMEDLRLKSEELETLEMTTGSQYVRWGRSTCPGNGTELVYTGYSAGSHYTHTGTSSNQLCLPKEPQWAKYDDAVQDNRGLVYGSEYEMDGTPVHASKDDEDALCSVCVTRRRVVVMIPARNTCFPGWTLEYRGYLVGGRADHKGSSEYICMDELPESGPPERKHNHNGNVWHLVEVRCGSLPCPPYVNGRELTCVVCSK